MKKMSLFTLAVCTGMAVCAQDVQLRTTQEVKPRFGIHAGVNLATFDPNTEDFSATNPAPNTNMKTSFHGGFFVNLPVGGNFSIQPELTYSGQGSKLSYNNGGTMTNYEEDLHYINLPVMVQAKSMGGFFVEAGPQLGYLVRAHRERSDGDQAEVDVRDSRKKTDFSLAGGIGYMSRVGLGVHGRYVYGFSNVLNADNDANQMPGKLNNRTVQIGLVYAFGAHK